jgi:hypothetical protein
LCRGHGSQVGLLLRSQADEGSSRELYHPHHTAELRTLRTCGPPGQIQHLSMCCLLVACIDVQDKLIDHSP